MVLMKPTHHSGGGGWKDPQTNCLYGIIWNVHKDRWRRSTRACVPTYLSLGGCPHGAMWAQGCQTLLIFFFFLKMMDLQSFIDVPVFKHFKLIKNTTSKHLCWPDKICLPFRCNPSWNLWPKCTFLLKNFEKHNWLLSCSWRNTQHCILETLPYFD